MAISKDKKQQLVADLKQRLEQAKMVVFATYPSISVPEIEDLRRLARESGVSIKVVKNRLMAVAMHELDRYKESDTTVLKGQLLYAFSSDDEVAPAQVLAKFAKTHPALATVGAFSDKGEVLSKDSVDHLATLPSKEQLLASVLSDLLSPLNDLTNAMSTTLPALIDGLKDRATTNN